MKVKIIGILTVLAMLLNMFSISLADIHNYSDLTGLGEPANVTFASISLAEKSVRDYFFVLLGAE